MFIRVVESNEVNLVLKHYQKTGYSKQVNPEDTIIAAFQANKIIGAVRLCPEDDYLLLRGMRVSQEYQRQGVGTALLKKCAEVIHKQTCYCLPYKHLVEFYERANFYEISKCKAPDILQPRFAKYIDMGLCITIMCRSES